MTMPKIKIFAFFLLALAGMACQTSVLGVPFAITTPTLEATVTSSPTPTPFPSATTTPASRSGIVCFRGDIANGALRVRECPGLTCREIGILGNGDRIAATGERKDIDGATWLSITSPITGWVNSRYVCEEGK